MTEGGASVATGHRKISSKVIPADTVLVGDVTGAVTEIVVLGVEIEVMSSGPLVGRPVVFKLVRTVP